MSINEEDVSAVKEVEEPRAWLPEAEKHEVGESGDQEAPQEGKETARRIAPLPNMVGAMVAHVTHV